MSKKWAKMSLKEKIREFNEAQIDQKWSQTVSDGNYFPLWRKKIDLGRLKIIFNPRYIYIIKVSF